MGTTKSNLFTAEQNEIATVAKVIGHPARVAIIQHLIDVDGCICGDLVDQIGLAQPTISQHLKELKSIGLIKGNIEGTKVCYCVDKDILERIQSLFNKFFNNPQSNKNNCC